MSSLYAIGDVHGRADLLAPLLDEIRRDAAARGEAPQVVFLGDIIDRGPASREAMDMVVDTLARHPGSRLILGNHEEFLLRFLDIEDQRETVARYWFANGGLATLASYGFGMTATVNAIAAAFEARFPAHIAAMREAEWKVETRDFLLVHGGIDPLLAADEQDPETTRWIREEFLDHSGPLPKTVVHGHTVTASLLPEIFSNRIALDTGAWRSGRLCCAVLEDGVFPPRFIAAEERAGKIAVAEIGQLV